ncbi:MAG: hypothetical protein ACRYGM_17090, partial [Janthinobacterium lividum]
MQSLRASIRLDDAMSGLLSDGSLHHASPSWPRRAAFLAPVLGSVVLGTLLAVQLTAGLADP